MYNFDEKIDRHGTYSVKYDCAKEFGKPEGLLPMWIADMDFKAAPCIQEKIIEIVENTVLGYSIPLDKYYTSVINWFQNYHGYTIDKNHIIVTPGILFALSSSIQAFTKENDSIIILSPVYPPFGFVVLNNHRRLVRSSLLIKDSRYYIDFEDFEKKIIENKVKMFILCSPHNPSGRIWEKDELMQLGEICYKHNVIIVSDEIHCDFSHQNKKHYMFPLISSKFNNSLILCTSPSKTFNIAGLQTSNIIIENNDMRSRFKKVVTASGWKEPNVFGIHITETAYNHGRDWFEKAKEYIWANKEYVCDFFSTNIPKVKVMEPDSTFLLWVDFRDLGLTHEKIEERLINKGKLWLDDGLKFGKEGRGFQRINIGCPRSVLDDCLKRILKALS